MIRELVPARAGISQIAMSPDQRRLALTWQASSGFRRVYVYDLERQISIELGAGLPGNHSWPTWLPDGSAVVYLVAAEAININSIVLEDAGGSSDRKVLVQDASGGTLISISADSKYVLYGGVEGDIWYVETAGGDPVRFRETENRETDPVLSPDGRTLAYSRVAVSGTSGLFVESFPEGGNAQAVETESWHIAQWSPDGTELFYSGSAGGIAAVSFNPESGLLTSRPETLFRDVALLGGFDVTADGDFIVPGLIDDEADAAPRLPILIENWLQMLDPSAR